MCKNFIKILALLGFLLPNVSLAADGNVSQNGDIAFMIMAVALVMLMVPGLALFYSGMVRHTNVVTTILHSMVKLSVVFLTWVVIGYTIAFGEDSFSGFIGSLDNILLNKLNGSNVSGLNFTDYIFATYQGMFAVITAAIITGAFAERVRTVPVIIFSVLWTIFVYSPVAHWVWGNGWLHKVIAPLDFAGGTVVHINSAVAGLVAAIIVGRRIPNKSDATPHNLPLTILGAGLLWFGWYGFNGGSSLAADHIAGLAVINTTCAAAAAGLSWMLVELLRNNRFSALGFVNGIIGGLVAITPAAGFVGIGSAIIIGIIAGMVCYAASTILKPKLNYDDSLDVFGIHGVGGFWGAIATGIFASTEVNPGGENGLLYGNSQLIIGEFVSCIVVAIYSAIMTWIIIKFIGMFIRVRTSTEDERKGLDESEHGESGYKYLR